MPCSFVRQEIRPRPDLKGFKNLSGRDSLFKLNFFEERMVAMRIRFSFSFFSRNEGSGRWTVSRGFAGELGCWGAREVG